MNIFERIVAFVEAVEPACKEAGLPYRPAIDIAIISHPQSLRPFAVEAGKHQADITMPSPYEQGWMVKWRGIHVIEDRNARKDRITVHLGFAPAVHFRDDGETLEAIEPVTTELPKKYRAVARNVLSALAATNTATE